jgi:hypothetical protein
MICFCVVDEVYDYDYDEDKDVIEWKRKTKGSFVYVEKKKKKKHGEEVLLACTLYLTSLVAFFYCRRVYIVLMIFAQ